jgi:uncharacterized protein (TIGR02453 family)
MHKMMLNSCVFPFLKSLKKNNNRDWFKENKPLHDTAKKHVQEFSIELFDLLKTKNQLDQQKVFRIYRDVRFSKNKTPYKTHFGLSFRREKPVYRGGYYLHIEPGASFLGVGFWGPNKEDLFRIRKEIEMDHEYFEKVVTNKNLLEKWGKIQGEKLKTAPKGFEKDHPGIEYLRHKQFVFIKNIDDRLLLDSSFDSWISEQLDSIRPFLNYMGEVLTSDLNGESIL